MSILAKWGEAQEIYKQTNRGAIVRSLFKMRPWRRATPYWLAALLYFVGSIASFIAFFDSMWATGPIVILAIIIYIWIEKRFGDEFQTIYLEHNLRKYPFFLRSGCLSYVLFAQEANSSTILSKNDVNSLVAWNSIRQEGLTSSRYFNNPVVLILLTFISGLLIEYLKRHKLIDDGYLAIIVFVVFLALWAGWLISDIAKLYTRKTVEICRYLQWWSLEERHN